MGRPKALLPFDGAPLIVHIVATLRRLFDEIIVVSADGHMLPPMPVEIVHDDVAYQGPVGGICYGLRATRTEVTFVTSCDSVFLNAGLISYLVSNIPGHDVVVPFWDGRLQPLHAVYRRSVLPLLEEQLVRGELRPISLFDRVRTCRIDEDDIRSIDPDGSSFFNMNTPDDYAAALERWGRLACIVELFGVARLVANTSEIPLALPAGATLADVFRALAADVPALRGRVISREGDHLVDGCTCNLNGREFVRTADSPVRSGDRIIIMSADAGG
jgi:molybdopterin-guanine dinucleotide biosynthesis protein A/molybdopterin converting factor small subunit